MIRPTVGAQIPNPFENRMFQSSVFEWLEDSKTELLPFENQTFAIGNPNFQNGPSSLGRVNLLVCPKEQRRHGYIVWYSYHHQTIFGRYSDGGLNS